MATGHFINYFELSWRLRQAETIGQIEFFRNLMRSPDKISYVFGFRFDNFFTNRVGPVKVFNRIPWIDFF